MNGVIQRVTRVVDRGRIERDVILVVAGLLVVFLVANCFTLGLRPSRWDVLLISGWFTFIVGLVAVRSVPLRFERVIGRLIRRGVLDSILEQALTVDMQRRARLLGYIGAAIAGLATFVAFRMAFGRSLTRDQAFLTLAECLGALIAGFYLGRMVGYGSFWHLLRSRNASIMPIPGHVDGAAGLKPIGDFYFYQACVASLPAAFAAVWLLLFPFFDVPKDPLASRYQNWREPYQLILGCGILFEVGAFIIPMLGFHRLMLQAKESYLHQADSIADELTKIDERLAVSKNLTAVESKALADRRDVLAKQYQALEDMPTWPIDRSVRKRFGTQNALLAIPFVFEMAGMQLTGTLKHLVDVAQKIAASQ